jgi:arylsulfatase A-like enzyme
VDVNTKAAGPSSARSMDALLAGRTGVVHPADQPIGYEAAGGAALYRGDYKLVRSAPPYGDGSWRLYDIAKDPTETHDLSEAQPQLKDAMLADYAAYVKQNGVVEVPSGYNVIQQAQINAAKR